MGISLTQGQVTLAHLVLTSRAVAPNLHGAEAWIYLKDTLLFILRHEFIDEDEPVALFICPTICVALIRLVKVSSRMSAY
jgi:hypothetical protein